MEEVLLQAAKQVPALAVLAGVVWVFIQHLERSRTHQESMSEQCHQVQRDGHKIIERNTEAMGKNSEALNNNSKIMQKFNGN